MGLLGRKSNFVCVGVELVSSVCTLLSNNKSVSTSHGLKGKYRTSMKKIFEVEEKTFTSSFNICLVLLQKGVRDGGIMEEENDGEAMKPRIYVDGLKIETRWEGINSVVE